MTWEKVRDFWIEEADEALNVTGHLLDKGEFSYSLFFVHLDREAAKGHLCQQLRRNRRLIYTKLRRLTFPLSHIHVFIKVCKWAGSDDLGEARFKTRLRIFAITSAAKYLN